MHPLHAVFEGSVEVHMRQVVVAWSPRPPDCHLVANFVMSDRRSDGDGQGTCHTAGLHL